ncbi:uncharacterized protein [Clytia hemisphaerica]|uniref:Cnidarian restricted protein n=1 Tax=Clytia hemisphaerica TaxID=252671 RepID=A0A7M6DRE4_9CNID|eukprot:TCONS_00013485-protein
MSLVKVLLLLLIIHLACGVSLGKDFHSLQQALDKIIEDFQQNPTNPRYKTQFTLIQEEFHIPVNVFIWSPIEQYGCNVKCLQHNCFFKPGQLTSRVDEGAFSPRMLFCVNNNVLLIQRIYLCTKENGCKTYSGSKDFFNLLPAQILERFPYALYHQSGFSFVLVDFLFEMVASGNNFRQISQILANLRNVYLYKMDKGQSLNNELTKFPSADKLENVFFHFFYLKSQEYQDSIDSRSPVLFISADHTFKVSRKAGGFRSIDNQFVSSDLKLFIVMDCTGSIVGWKLTESTKHNELKDLIHTIHSRFPNLGQVVIDNCCQDRELYRGIFGTNIDIKLDLFHAVQRISKLFPNRRKNQMVRKFISDFGLIFRDPMDLGKTRKRPTPNKEVILKNLDTLFVLHRPFLSTLSEAKSNELDEEIRKLKVHIEKGCLSGIAPGDGTEQNENLHRLLNRSLLRGVSFVGHELLLAILTLLFYYHNERTNGKKHKCNSKIVPIFPPPSSHAYKTQNQIDDVVTSPAPFYQENLQYDKQNNEDHKQLVKMAFDIMNTTFTVVKEIGKICLHRAFKATDILMKNLTLDSSLNEKNHTDILQYNLNAFQRSIVQVPRDGDCCFRSILLQIHQVIHSVEQTEQLQRQLNELNLGNDITDIDNDITQLRSLFVERLQIDGSYRTFLVENDFEDIETFKERGVFASNNGDFVVKVVCDILRVPITILQSNARLNVQTFIPVSPVFEKPLLIAYNVFEVHYSATKETCESAAEEESQEKDVPVKSAHCYCKKGCVTGKTKKCPCLIASRDCSKKCRCISCHNNKPVNTKGCRCTTSCGGNKSAVRKTKCYCYKKGLSCQNCKCKNCKNPFGLRNEDQDTAKKEPKKRNRNSFKSYRRLRTEEFLTDSGSLLELPEGSWTDQETVCLFTCAEVVYVELKGYQPQPIQTLYNFLVDNGVSSFPKIKMRTKTLKQISGKLAYMGFK